MTALVGIRCSDGVVIGSDSSVTLGTAQLRTVEQPTTKKLQIVGDRVIVASSGYVGHAQRFHRVVESMWQARAFQNGTDLDIAKKLSYNGIADFKETHMPNLNEFFSLVAFPASNDCVLCELHGSVAFQPEIKQVDDLWYTSAGGGQQITDPFLALLRAVFWSDQAPNLQGGIFTALWALQHACEVNPGGIKAPIGIAVLARDRRGQWAARLLSEEELGEQGNMVEEATKHLASFKDLLLGHTGAKRIPKP